MRWIESKREREREVKRGEKEGGRKIRLERKVKKVKFLKSE